jgi:K+ transporter
MIVKVRKYEEVKNVDVDSILREDVYDNIVSYNSEVGYCDNQVVHSMVTTIDKEGHHMFFNLDEVTIYIMNDEGKTIDKFMRREVKVEDPSTLKQMSVTIDADKVVMKVQEKLCGYLHP